MFLLLDRCSDRLRTIQGKLVFLNKKSNLATRAPVDSARARGRSLSNQLRKEPCGLGGWFYARLVKVFNLPKDLFL